MKNYLLKSYRVAAGLTQHDVSQALGVSPTQYSRLELGQLDLNPDGWAKLAGILRTDVASLTDKPSRDRYAQVVTGIMRSSKVRPDLAASASTTQSGRKLFRK